MPTSFKRCLTMLQKVQKKSTRRSIVSQPELQYNLTKLTVSDVHRDFEAETQISCCWCGPCHGYLLVGFQGGYFLQSHRSFVRTQAVDG